MYDDDNGEGVNDDDIGAIGGALEWEFGFALDLKFVPPCPPIHPTDVGFLFGGELKIALFCKVLSFNIPIKELHWIILYRPFILRMLDF